MDSDRATFICMEESTENDWRIIGEHYSSYITNLSDRIVEHLLLLKGDCGGYAVDRLEHCLQTATRAYRDKRDEEYVVCALLHDIGDTLGPSNHADVAATILQPYVSEENHWVVKHHGIFQGYYFFHYLGLDRNGRDAFKEHKYYQACVDFCLLYDQNSFDPEYDSEPLDFFIPMIKRVFSQVKKSIYL